MTPDREHYVYVHRHADDGRVFYVGKGKDRRAWSTCGRNRHWRFVVAKHGRDVEILRSKLPEPCALSLERATIAAIGGGLVNLTDGGGGAPGWKHSPETKARIGAYWKGRILTPKMRDALAAYNTGKKLTPEHRAKLSAAKAGRSRGPLPAATRAKIAASHIGIKPSDASRRKMSAAKIGKAVGRNSPSYDHTIRHWRNDDGREFVGTRGDLIIMHGLADGCVSAVISGRQKSVKGWRLI